MGAALQHSVGRILSDLLINGDQGTIPADGEDWPTFHSWHPPEPNNLVCVYVTSPDIHGRQMIDGEVQEHHGFQVKVRAEDNDTGDAKAQAIDRFLTTTVKRTLVTIGGQGYIIHAVTRRSGILPIGRDPAESQLDLFTINYVVSIGLE